MHHILLIALGGALGAIARYGAGKMILVASHPHLNTLLINLTGCLAIGVAWSVIEGWQLSQSWKSFTIAGFLGGFTTYSSFSLETMQLLNQGRVIESMCYAAVTVVGCIAACALGLWITSKFMAS